MVPGPFPGHFCALVPVVPLARFAAPVGFVGVSVPSYVSSAICGGLTPIVLAYWLRTDPMAPAYYVGGLALLGAGIGVRSRFSRFTDI